MTEVPKITFSVKEQRIQWFVHMMRRPDSENIKATVEWKDIDRTFKEAMGIWGKAIFKEVRDLN